jgi:hypothetical protein
MEVFISALFDTEWGLIFIFAMLMIALSIEFFNNKPRF